MKRLLVLLVFLSILIRACASCEEEDYIIAQPGDSGVDVEIVLGKGKELGFIQELADGTDEYAEEYVPGIMQMEQALGLTEDGIIHLSEFTEIETAIAKGSKSETVKEMLERLFESGYIRNILPAKHDTYDKEYESAVKNAEKKLGLRVDGILTASEQEALRNESLEELAAPGRISVKLNQGTATVSWSAVQGAVYYTVIRDGSEVVKVGRETSWIDNDAEMGETHKYSVRAETYLRQSRLSAVETVKIPFVSNIRFSDSNNKKTATQTNLSPVGDAKELYFSSGGNLKAGTITVYSVKQQQLKNNCTRFIITFKAPAGFRISAFNPPNGSILMYVSANATSGYKEAAQFDVSNSKLTNMAYSMTIKFFKYGGSDDHLYVSPQLIRQE